MPLGTLDAPSMLQWELLPSDVATMMLLHRPSSPLCSKTKTGLGSPGLSAGSQGLVCCATHYEVPKCSLSILWVKSAAAAGGAPPSCVPPPGSRGHPTQQYPVPCRTPSSSGRAFCAKYRIALIMHYFIN